jgi:DNA repair protein RadC
MPSESKRKVSKMSIDNEKVRMHRLPIYRVALVRESSQPSMLNRITTPRNVYEIASSYLEGVDREHFVVIMLDTKNQVIGINTVAIGVLASCPIHPREVFKPAILVNAAGVILLHNHPSGDPSPSQDDLLLTSRLREAGEVLGIQVVDHVILGYANYVSLKEKGRI